MLPARTGFPLNAAAVLLNVAAKLSTPRGIDAPYSADAARRGSWPRRAHRIVVARATRHHARQPDVDRHAQMLQLQRLPQQHSLSLPSAIRDMQAPEVVSAARHWTQEQLEVVLSAVMVHLTMRLLASLLPGSTSWLVPSCSWPSARR